MNSKVNILKVFDCYQTMQVHIFECRAMHQDYKVNINNRTIELPASKIYFRVIDNLDDAYEISSLTFQQVDLDPSGLFDHEVVGYLRSRIRYL